MRHWLAGFVRTLVGDCVGVTVFSGQPASAATQRSIRQMKGRPIASRLLWSSMPAGTASRSSYRFTRDNQLAGENELDQLVRKTQGRPRMSAQSACSAHRMLTSSRALASCSRHSSRAEAGRLSSEAH